MSKWEGCPVIACKNDLCHKGCQHLAHMQFNARIRASERQIAESDLYFPANRWEIEQ